MENNNNGKLQRAKNKIKEAVFGDYFERKALQNELGDIIARSKKLIEPSLLDDEGYYKN